MGTATCCCRSTRIAGSRARAWTWARSASRCTRWTTSRECCSCGPRQVRSWATGCKRSLAGLLDVHLVQRGAQPARQRDGVGVRPVVHKKEVRAVGQHVTVERRDDDAIAAQRPDHEVDLAPEQHEITGNRRLAGPRWLKV